MGLIRVLMERLKAKQKSEAKNAELDSLLRSIVGRKSSALELDKEFIAQLLEGKASGAIHRDGERVYVAWDTMKVEYSRGTLTFSFSNDGTTVASIVVSASLERGDTVTLTDLCGISEIFIN